MKPLLSINNLHVSVEEKKIISSLSLSVAPGEMHVIMGPNGSGKSTLAYGLLAHPHYIARATKFEFAGRDLKKLSTDERARLGLFLGFQYPLAISGITLNTLLPAAIRAQGGTKKNPTQKTFAPTLAAKMHGEKTATLRSLRELLGTTVSQLHLDDDMLERSLNDGFSGGEKKKAEVLQMVALKPRLAILDEPDSGLDIDSLKLIANAVHAAHQKGTAVILITHYQRILKYLKPDRVHVMMKGRIVKSGDADLAKQIEQRGYENIQTKR